jgi:hypothetical protein
VRSTVEEDSLANINAMIGEVLSADNLSKLIDSINCSAKRAKAGADRPRELDAPHITAAPQSRPGERAQSIVYEISYESARARGGRPPSATRSPRCSSRRASSAATRRRGDHGVPAQRARAHREGAAGAVGEVTEFRQAHRGELPDEQETSLRRLELLSTQRESLRQQITAKEDRLISISTHGRRDSEGELLIADLRRQLAREIAIHTDEHPNVIALRERLARLEEANRKNPLPPAPRAWSTTSAARSRACASSATASTRSSSR